jgi:hypothetical protein
MTNSMATYSELCHSAHTTKWRVLEEPLSWLGSGSFLPLRLILHASLDFLQTFTNARG